MASSEDSAITTGLHQAVDSHISEHEYSKAEASTVSGEVFVPGFSRQNSSGSESDANRVKIRTWTVHFFRMGPLAGIFSLLLAALSIWVSFGILMGARNAPTKDWSVEPSAYLAICTAVANQSMRHAAFQGFIIAWWTGALRGSTLGGLHTGWRAGMTVFGALTAGRKMGFLGIACIVSTLVAVDGPLLQKATKVVSAPFADSPIPLNVTMAQEVPTDLL